MGLKTMPMSENIDIAKLYVYVEILNLFENRYTLHIICVSNSVPYHQKESIRLWSISNMNIVLNLLELNFHFD